MKSPTRSIIIQILPTGDEYDVEMPASATGAEIIEELTRIGALRATDTYDLIRSKDATKIAPDKNLLELGLEDGETISIAPRMVAPKQKYSPEEVDLYIRLAPPGPDNFHIAIRFMPRGDMAVLEVSGQTAVKEIYSIVFRYNLAPEFDSHENPYVYDILSARTNSRFDPESRLKEQDIEPGDILYFTPRLLAGGTGNMIYEIPVRLALGEKTRCRVRIATHALKDFLLNEGLGEEATLSKIEIGSLMAVSIEENSIQEHLSIKSLNTPEQIVGGDFYSEWNFDLIPKKAGFSSVILRVSMLDILEGFGERRKDVFFLDKEIEIGARAGRVDDDFQAFPDFEHVYKWSPRFRDELYDLIGQNETGQALSKIANFFQKSDLGLFDAILLLQAQWNAGRNQHMLNLIPASDWLMVQTRVNYSILEIVRNVESGHAEKSHNGAPVEAIRSQLEGIGNHF